MIDGLQELMRYTNGTFMSRRVSNASIFSLFDFYNEVICAYVYVYDRPKVLLLVSEMR